MARARNIKPGFFANEDLVELSFEYRLLFIGLWTLADREGRLEDRPKRIKMAVFPADTVDVEDGLRELTKAGFIKRYEANGVSVVQILSFTKHQNPHHTEKASDLPDESGSISVKASTKKEHNGDLTVKAQEQNGEYLADSLNPDSLNPESIDTPLPPLQGEIDGDDENEETDDQPAKPKRESSVTLSTYLQNCSQQGCKAVPDDHFIRGWAETAGIDAEMMQVAWFAFRDDHIHGGRKAKKYKDWPAAFANSVKAGWYRLWFIPANGPAEWSTQGRAAQRNYGEVSV